MAINFAFITNVFSLYTKEIFIVFIKYPSSIVIECNNIYNLFPTTT